MWYRPRVQDPDTTTPREHALTEVTLRGFKAVKEATLKLGPLSLLIGRNGSGKSSFIEGLQWLQEALFDGLDEATSSRFRHFSDLLNRRSKAVGVELWFKGASSVDVHYSLEAGPSSVAGGARQRPMIAREDCVVGRTRAAHKVLFSRKGKRGPPFRWLRGPRSGRPLVLRDGDTLALAHASSVRAPGALDLEAYLRQAVFLRLSPTMLARPTPPRGAAAAPLLAEDGADLPALVDKLTPEARARLAERVAGVIDGVKAVDVAGVEQRWITVRERMKWPGGSKNVELPAWMLSEGTRRIVAIFALLELDPPPSLIAIEEVENGLDPWTLEIVLDSLRNAAAAGIQVILTTHSPFLLDHVEPAQVIHVRRARGDTTYEAITSFEEIAKYEGILAPGAMYLSRLFEPRK